MATRDIELVRHKPQDTSVDTYVTHEGMRYLVRARMTSAGTVYQVFEASSLVEPQHDVLTHHDGALWGLVTTRTGEHPGAGRGLLRRLVLAVYPGLEATDLGDFLLNNGGVR